MKRLILWSLFALIFAANVWAQNPAPQQVIVGAPPDSKKTADVRQQTFEIVWQTVKDKHFDPTLGGVDWEKVRQQYQPKVAETKSDAELYRLLQQMLGELHQSHFNIIPPEAVISDDAAEPPTGGIGIDLRMIDGAAVIVRVEPESMADASGLRPGFVIKQIGDKTVDSLIAPLTKGTQSEAIRKLQMARRVLREINGDPGTSVAIVYADDKDKTNLAVVTRTKMKGELSPKLGNFPPQYTEFESKRLPGNIGYIRFNIFTTPISEKVRAALAEFHDAKGVIFDLRGNPGGVAGIATGIAGRLSEKNGVLGTMKMRTSELKFAIFPQQDAYTGPLAILIDGMSASTSEVFSSGMQGLGRAIVIGETSAGACLPSYFQKLPTGALFQFAIADFKTSKGVLIEGRGVIPDLEVKWNRASLISGHDAQLETAIERLAQSRQPERSFK
ncbi:MAG: hypothetical protein JST85_07325 [Acidobacteria bacterium]|nr:hypothetical protein [Acidobacteriota bacterium]